MNRPREWGVVILYWALSQNSENFVTSLPACLSVSGRIFMKFDVWDFFRKSLEKKKQVFIKI
jgi:hypothetical protein